MISVFGSSLGEEEIAEVADSIRNQWIGMGPKTDAFEKAICAELGLPNLLLVNSGSNALYMGLAVLDLPPGSEVILPSFTWVACAQAVVLAGAKPVFCDVNAETLNMDLETVQPLITSKTAAIMPVHYAGRPVDMDPLLELGIPIIEDAAHAIYSTYDGKACGSMGDIGIYSFDAIKNLAIGEGGGLTFKDPAHYERAKKLRYCGIGKSGFQQAEQEAQANWWEYDISEVFIKMLPSDLGSAIGLVQLKKRQALQARRRQIWDRYQQAFESIPWLSCPADEGEKDSHSYFTYLIRLPKRNELAHHLLKNGVYTTFRYHPLHLNAIYGCTDQHLPVSEALNQDGLNIPLHPRITEDEQEMIIDLIIEWEKKMSVDRMRLSMVIPVFRNKESLQQLFQEVSSAIPSAMDCALDWIFVDDGSDDGSIDVLKSLNDENPNVQVIELSRNFGQVAAITAGLREASGDAVVVMGADLQEPADMIPRMLEAWKQGNEVVIANRMDRNDPLADSMSAKLFYKLMSLSKIDMPKGGFDFVLLDRAAYQALNEMQGHNRFLQGDILWLGFEQKLIPYERRSRPHGKSQWSQAKKLKYVIDGVLATSYWPIRMMSFLGFLIALMGFAYAILIVIMRVVNQTPYTGWAPLMIGILVIGGMIMLMLGLVGEYLWRIYDEVRGRPGHIVRRRYANKRELHD